MFASLVQPVVIAVPLPMPHRATRARRATADVQGDNDVLVTIPKATGSELLAVSARGLVRFVAGTCLLLETFVSARCRTLSVERVS